MSDTFTSPIGSNDTFNLVLTIIQTVYGVVLLVLMIFISFFIGFKKSYTAPFFLIIQVELVVNIVYFINSYISLRLANIPVLVPILKYLEEFAPGFLTFSRYLNDYFFYFQGMLVMFMIAHRIIQINKQRPPKVWKKSLAIAVLLITVLSFLPNLLFIRGFPIKTVLSFGVLLEVSDVNLVNTSEIVTGIISVIYLGAMVFLGVWLFRLRNESKNAFAIGMTGITFYYCFFLLYRTNLEYSELYRHLFPHHYRISPNDEYGSCRNSNRHYDFISSYYLDSVLLYCREITVY